MNNDPVGIVYRFIQIWEWTRK